ncbi:MAG: hypothetical protein JWN14_2004 [Chthonomonadales bacterium]|nr:hypothetical protein [Chthonomonadales bacterium]
MSAETYVFEPLVRRSLSSDLDTRHAALKQITELSDDDLLALLGNHTQPASPKARILARRLKHGALYGAFAFAVIGSFSHAPAQGIVVFMGLWMALMTVIVARYGWRAILSVSRGPNSRRSGPTPLFGSILMHLIGRTDPRFLPYLLSDLGDRSFLFEREQEREDASPIWMSRYSMSLHRPPDSVLRVSRHELVQHRRRYRKLLQAMLPQIGPEASIELSKDQVFSLLIFLQMPEEDVELTLLVLARLEQWGDAQAVPVLKRLIREKHWYVGSDRVEEAARQCLAQVEIRLQQQKQGDTLLRPTQGMDAIPPRALLRPAADSSENAPEQLLRPESSPPPDGRR